MSNAIPRLPEPLSNVSRLIDEAIDYDAMAPNPKPAEPKPVDEEYVECP